MGFIGKRDVGVRELFRMRDLDAVPVNVLPCLIGPTVRKPNAVISRDHQLISQQASRRRRRVQDLQHSLEQ